MLKALYYPHTDIHSPVIIANALVLWDQIETIIPNSQWTPNEPTGDERSQTPNDKWFREAVELVVERRVPSEDERQQAHVSLSNLVKDGSLANLVHQSPASWRSRDYLVYPDKFLDQTWHMLEHGGLARWVANAADYGVPSAVGFLMMSILADVCAGTQIQKITDRHEAYGWLGAQRAKILNSQFITDLDISQVAPAHDRLVSLSLEVLDARKIPLRKLVEFRKRELRSGSADYRKMRHRYARLLNAHIERLGKHAKSASDVKELDRQFREELRDDLADLKNELGLTSIKTLLSKEVALSALILAGTFLSPIAGITSLANNFAGIGIIPLVKAGVNYSSSRRKVLRKHAMSWLFLTNQGPLTLR